MKPWDGEPGTGSTESETVSAIRAQRPQPPRRAMRRVPQSGPRAAGDAWLPHSGAVRGTDGVRTSLPQWEPFPNHGANDATRRSVWLASFSSSLRCPVFRPAVPAAPQVPRPSPTPGTLLTATDEGSSRRSISEATHHARSVELPVIQPDPTALGAVCDVNFLRAHPSPSSLDRPDISCQHAPKNV